jgi:enoyl-CoA hydratase
MSYDNLIIEKRGAIFLITINREKKLNALNRATIFELGTALLDAQNDRSIGGIIITGAGEKAFVAGADIAELAVLSAEEGMALARNAQANVFDLIEHSAKPVIAAINGFALGGGLELALACHIRIASENIRLGLPEVSLGLIPGYGGTQRLTRLVGKGKSFEIILTGDMISSEEAQRIGLVNHITPLPLLLTKAEELLNKILLRSPEAIASAIKAINASSRDTNGFEIEIAEFGKCFTSDNLKEGINAFLDKRKPLFKRQ